jgi:hypothetical protein
VNKITGNDKKEDPLKGIKSSILAPIKSKEPEIKSLNYMPGRITTRKSKQI